jgi:hypothetical protein
VGPLASLLTPFAAKLIHPILELTHEPANVSLVRPQGATDRGCVRVLDEGQEDLLLTRRRTLRRGLPPLTLL